MGGSFGGVVCSDRWRAYAHLLRDFTAMLERYGSPWHGRQLADCARQVMDAYTARQAGDIDHAEIGVAPNWRTRSYAT